MQLIRCTAKLRKELGIKNSDLQDNEPKFSFLGQWHANIIYINRRKCVIFANDRTRFNFIEPDVTRSYIREMPNWFPSSLSCVLNDHMIPKDIIDKILDEYHEIQYSKSNDKSVLGTLTDLAYLYEEMIINAGGVYSPHIPDIIRKLNHMPMKPLRWKYAIDELKGLYGLPT